MKNLPVIIFALIAVTPAWALAGTVEDTFLQGVEQYRNSSTPEEFARAAESFRILNQTYRIKAPEVLLNLGASEFLSSGATDGEDRTGEAMLTLHRAIATAPDSLAAGIARKNLETIRHSLNERHSGGNHSGYVFAPYNDGWTAMFSWLAPEVARAVFLSLWALLFIVLAARRLLPHRLAVILPAVTAVLAAAAGAGALGASRVEGYSTGVVLESAPIYDEFLSIEPDGTLPEGLEFRLLERRDQRLRIRLSSGRDGWVPEKRVGIL